jgi:hypothetical protein
LGSPCDLYFRIAKPDGSTVAEANVTGADEGSLTTTLKDDGTYLLLVEELNYESGPDLNYVIDVSPSQPGFTLTADNDKLTAAPGKSVELKINATRRDYDGPISLRLTQPELRLTNSVLPAKTNAVALSISVPAELEPGTLVQFSVIGEAQTNEAEMSAIASTLARVRAAMPNQLFPPRALDGIVSLGVIASPEPAAEKEK